MKRKIYIVVDLETGQPIPMLSSNMELLAKVNWLLIKDKTYVPYGSSNEQIEALFEIRNTGKVRIEAMEV